MHEPCISKQASRSILAHLSGLHITGTSSKLPRLCVAGIDDGSLSSTLQQGCPSYFREEDKIYFAANGELRRAQALQGGQRQDVTRAALDKLIRVCASLPVVPPSRPPLAPSCPARLLSCSHTVMYSLQDMGF